MVLFISNFNYTKELVALKTLGMNTKKFFILVNNRSSVKHIFIFATMQLDSLI
jgi:hypothetical protein